MNERTKRLWGDEAPSGEVRVFSAKFKAGSAQLIEKVFTVLNLSDEERATKIWAGRCAALGMVLSKNPEYDGGYSPDDVDRVVNFLEHSRLMRVVGPMLSKALDRAIAEGWIGLRDED
jgi:hypothetical protein